MTDDKTKATQLSGAAKAASLRIARMEEVFDNMRAVLLAQIEDLGEVKPGAPKHVVARLNDLQAAQFSLLKAEEAFHDKFFQSEDDADAIDYDAIRVELGRRLDRIRENQAAKAVSDVAKP